jgi:hypothetical protein
VVWWLVELACAYDPPSFTASTRWYSDAATVRADWSQPALSAANIPIYAVITTRATDPRHASLAWGSETEAALERTWETWSQNPSFDPASSVLVLVAVEERSVRVKAGSTWDATFGFHNAALTAFTERHFVPKARAGDLDAALAETVTALATAMAGARDMPVTLPGPTITQTVTVAPPSPLLPRVASAVLKVPEVPPTYLVVGQNLPSAGIPYGDRRRLMDALRPPGDDVVLVLWDVRGDQILVSLGPTWEGVADGTGGWEAELGRSGRDAEGHLNAVSLVPALETWLQRATSLRNEAEIARRRVWSKPVPERARFQTWPANLQESWADVRRALDKVSEDVDLVVIDRADREGSLVGPDGVRWSSHIADLTLGPSGTGMVVVLDPFDVEVRGQVTFSVDRTFVQVALPATVPEGATGQERVLSWIDQVQRDIGQATQKELDAAARRRQADQLLFGGVAAGVAVPIVGGLGWWIMGAVMAARRRLAAAIEAVVEDRNLLQARVGAARERLDDLRLDAEMRAQIRVLRDRGPTTRDLYREVGALLDALELGLRHLETRLDSLGRERPQSWGDVGTLRRALDAPVQVQATDAQAPDLFDLPPEPRVEPIETFMEGLNDRFRHATAGVVRLQDARAATARTVEADLASDPNPEIADLPVRIHNLGLPASWLDDHPGGREAKNKLDTLRSSDPVAYLDALADARAQVAAFETERDAWLDHLEALADLRTRGLSAVAQAAWVGELDKTEHPATLAQAAQTAEQRAWEAARGHGDFPVAARLAHASWEAWRAVLDADAKARAAPEVSASRLADATARLAQTRRDIEEAKVSVDVLARRITGLNPLLARLDQARTDLAEGEVALATARTFLQERRFTSAVRECDRVVHETVEAAEDLAEFARSLQEASSTEAAMSQAMTSLVALRAEHQKLLQEFRHDEAQLANGDARLAALQARMQQGPVPPDDVFSEAERIREAWKKPIHVLEIARAEAAALHRELTQASERRRSSAYTTSNWGSSSTRSSSSSSSFGSSYGHSGGSSFGSSSSRSGGSSFRGSSGRSGGSSFRGSSGRSGGSTW